MKTRGREFESENKNEIKEATKEGAIKQALLAKRATRCHFPMARFMEECSGGRRVTET